MESAAVAVVRLLGPPVIRAARQPHDAAGDRAASHPFLHLLDAAFNVPPPPAASGSKPKPRKARTENDSATYTDSGNPCLDFFFQVVPDMPANRVRSLLVAVWAYDPLTALKLICNLRGVRGTGKSDREGFYAAALWMHEHHPRTLACNIAALAEFGYLKDFPELLFRLIHGNDVRKLAKAKAAAHKMHKSWEEATLAGRKRSRGHALSRGCCSIVDAMPPAKPLLSDFVSTVLSTTKTKSKSKPKLETSSSNSDAAMEINKPEEVVQPVAMDVDGKPEKEKEKEGDGKPEKKEVSKKARKAVKLAVQSLEKYYGDRAYRFLFDCVAEFFAELLASDLEQLPQAASGGRSWG